MILGYGKKAVLARIAFINPYAMTVHCARYDLHRIFRRKGMQFL